MRLERSNNAISLSCMLSILLLFVWIVREGDGEASSGSRPCCPRSTFRPWLRLRGGSEAGNDEFEAFKRQLQQFNEVRARDSAGTGAGRGEVGSSEVSEGTDSSEWLSPRARELMSQARSKRAEPAGESGGRAADSSSKRQRTQAVEPRKALVEEEKVQLPEELPLGDGAR
eukprot:331768-Hanusia_phi.AAC.5